MLEKYQNLPSKAGAKLKIQVHWSDSRVNKAGSKPIIPNQCNEFQINAIEFCKNLDIFDFSLCLLVQSKHN